MGGRVGVRAGAASGDLPFPPATPRHSPENQELPELPEVETTVRGLARFLEGERIELTHRVSDRRIFALGALAAARFLAEQAPGHYTMRDVLGL